MDFRSKVRRRIKIIVMGNSGVGKTCLIKRFCEKRFTPKYVATVGIDYGVTQAIIGDKEVRVNIFDFAGHPIFYEVRNEFYQDTHGALLVYDIGDHNSFESLNLWLAEMTAELNNSTDLDNIITMVCGNKCDKKREVEEADGKLWANLHGFSYFETSAMTGDFVTEVFHSLFSSIVTMLEGGIRTDLPKTTLKCTKEQLQAIHRLRWAKDDYEKLGLTHGASREDVNRAYRKLAVLLHPDKSTAPGSEDAFKTLVTTRLNLLRHAKF